MGSSMSVDRLAHMLCSKDDRVHNGNNNRVKKKKKKDPHRLCVRFVERKSNNDLRSMGDEKWRI